MRQGLGHVVGVSMWCWGHEGEGLEGGGVEDKFGVKESSGVEAGLGGDSSSPSPSEATSKPISKTCGSSSVVGSSNPIKQL
jgi:hypothetical protein